MTSSTPTTSGTPSAPDGTRWVGLVHAAIAVPQDWGTNRLRCGTPQHDTVIIDVSALDGCRTDWPRGVDSVLVSYVDPTADPETADPAAGEQIEIDGVTAIRQATACTKQSAEPRLCSGTVYVPSERVSFYATSASNAAGVDDVLRQIRILPDRVGVPGYQRLNLDEQGGATSAYLDALEWSGLRAEVRTKRAPAVPVGYVLDVSPRPGTLLRPGDVVTVTAVAEPTGPAEEVRVDVTTVHNEERYRTIGDPRIRAGATITIAMGDRISAYADGKRSGTLAGKLKGTSLAVDGWKEGPNYPHSWIAVAPGRTTITLTVTADGKPARLGSVTVLVR